MPLHFCATVTFGSVLTALSDTPQKVMRDPLNILTNDIGWMTARERRRLYDEISGDHVQLRESARLLFVRDAVRAEWLPLVEDRELIVLFALDSSGQSELLTNEERSRLDDRRHYLVEAMSEHPALNDIVERIVEDAREFERLWPRTSPGSAPREDRREARRGRDGRAMARTAWRLTAVAAIAVFASVMIFVTQREASRVTLAVDEGQIRQVNLIDGSSIRLVGPASLSYRSIDVQERPGRVSLEGGAYFDVVSGSDPFVVETRDARVAVLGTNFGVRADDRETTVILASGMLAVSRRDRPSEGVELGPGESCTVRAGAAPSRVTPVDLVDAFAWAELFVFRGTSIAEIADNLSQHYDVVVEFEPALADQKISGTFERSGDVREILGVVASSLGAQVVDSEGRLRLTSISD